MSNLYAAKLVAPEGANLPDPWDHSDGVALPLNAVISRDERGNPLSYVGDFVWNWQFYTARKKKSPIGFQFWKTVPQQVIADSDYTAERVAIVRELQYLMVLRIYHTPECLAYKTLYEDSKTLWLLARFAEEHSCSIKNILERADLLDAFITCLSSSRCSGVVVWIKFLRSLDATNVLGFTLAEPRKWGELKERARAYGRNAKQTAPLPTRIYLGLINAISAELDVVEAHRDSIISALREGMHLHAQHRAKGVLMGASFGPELIDKHGLREFLEGRGYGPDIDGLTGAVTNIFRLCKTQIHTFSGMRDEEAEYLPYHCMETVNAGHGRKHSLFVGVTTKLTGSRRKRTRWVTTDAQGFRAVRLVQSFSSVVYEFIGVKPSGQEETKDDFPLFVSTDYLPWGRMLEVPTEDRYAPLRSLGLGRLSDSLKTILRPIIEATDIAELEEIDAFRDWSSEPDFAVGQPWPLATHQLRRSLALYANASGLVQISSLRRQLQHITREMSEYYSRGSVFAKNFLADDPEEFTKHVCVDWQSSESEAQYLAFTRDVLNSEEPLCGVGGRFFDLQKQRGEVMSKKEVATQIKMGRLAYKSHPLGGCTSLGSCDKQKGLRLTSGICISEQCKSLVGKHSSILKLIPIQREIVSRMDPDSIAAQMETEELEILEAAEVQWQSPNLPVTGIPGVGHV